MLSKNLKKKKKKKKKRQGFLNFSRLAPARQVAFNFRVVTPGCCDTGATWAEADVGYRMLVNGYNSCVSSLSTECHRRRFWH